MNNGSGRRTSKAIVAVVACGVATVGALGCLSPPATPTPVPAIATPGTTHCYSDTSYCNSRAANRDSGTAHRDAFTGLQRIRRRAGNRRSYQF